MDLINVLMLIGFTIFNLSHARDVSNQQQSLQNFSNHPPSRKLIEKPLLKLKYYDNHKPPTIVARYASSTPRFYRPVIRRRYQTSNGPPQPSYYQNRGIPQFSQNYKYKKSPSISSKVPVYYKQSTSYPVNYMQKFNKNYYQQGPQLQSKISSSHNQQYPISGVSNTEFHASPPFVGNVIVKSAQQPTAKTQLTSPQQFSNNNYDFNAANQYHHHQPSDHHHLSHYQEQQQYPTQNKSPPIKYSSYAVYDDSANESESDDDDYVTELPPHKYFVKTTEPNEDAKKFLNFMSSSNYFLPNLAPDYHTKSVDFNLGISSTESPPTGLSGSHDLYRNYKNNYNSGRVSAKNSNNNNNNDNHNNNYNHHKVNANLNGNGPEKIEFTESDAIHSSFTSNPKEILDTPGASSAVNDIYKGKYGNNQKYKVSYNSKFSHRKSGIKEDVK